MTVKELAKYLKLSEMMIYKLAQSGELPAAKVGSAWRFSQNQIDEWLMKKSSSDAPFPEEVKVVIEDFVDELQKRYKENLSTVIIFGSYARGDYDDDSDVDILVVLKEVDDYWKRTMEVHDLAYSLTFERDRPIVISVFVMTEKRFLTGSSPTLMNIRKEGVRAA